jgi:SAM-dependent methyltransferase
MSERIYCFNKELRVWLTPEHDTMAYSDGEAVERQLLESLRKCRDLSSTSDELRKRIVDWPTEYHLSPQRHALLRPFTILPGDRVLELGCGCGAITRHLGETGATVVAVEGSQIRAQIAAERCRDLPNVSVYCDNLAAFENPDEFDFVTLIGVLEYSPQFIVGEDPVGTCLCKAKSHLRDCGSLILAIENRLGLKYLSGCKEDHVGHAFFGIEDLYDASTAVTLGRVELLTSLEAAGFAASQTLFPFPDYKLPDIIISEAGLADPRFRTSELLLRNHSPDRVAAGPRAFSEPLAWVTVCRNDLLPDLSNSFLVIAGKSGAAIQSRLRSFLAVSFTGRRVRRYITETLFHCAEGAIAVTKQTLPHRSGQKPYPPRNCICTAKQCPTFRGVCT